jgi:hypothetical protein
LAEVLHVIMYANVPSKHASPILHQAGVKHPPFSALQQFLQFTICAWGCILA